eukprot:TRINITY_DN8756_c0_g1_i1.p1 TRINITY_DN8756_c0_g1~~TRINITY_DN8756_c0_g1_i1.p1  ORF type:complete len:349 (-),score=100.12 TRINITY_DN8756_c0_g1_i1:28-948(-)
MEEKRSDDLKYLFGRYTYFCSSVPTIEKTSNDMSNRFIELMDSETELALTAEQNKAPKTAPPPIVYEPYTKDKARPKSPGRGFELIKNKFLSASDLVRNKRGLSDDSSSERLPESSVFKRNLDDIMADQQSTHPNLHVPYVLVKLIEDIIAKEGLQTEGLFRIPAMADDVRKTKAKIEEGKYDFTDTSVHTSASVLKLWLRELRTPIFPESVYDECLKVCYNQRQCVQIKERLPAHNKAVLEKLLDLFNQMISPYNLEKNKMGPENLSVIFSPCLLRPAHDDISNMIQNSKLETIFVCKLIESSCK